MANMGTVAVVWNGRSGMMDRRAELDRFLAALADYGLAAELLHSPEGLDAGEQAQRAVQSGAGTIVAAGGDGTANAVAGAVAGTGIRMAVLPWGTLNHFARDAGVPREPEETARLIAQRSTIEVDVGEVNRQVFLNNSSIGSYATSVRWRRAHQLRGWPKWPAMVVGIYHSLLYYPMFRVRLEAGGRQWLARTPFLFVGNNEYQVEGRSIGARTDLAGGHLHYCIAPPGGRLALIGTGLRAVFAKLVAGRDYDTGTCRELRIVVRRRHVAVAYDGEVRRFRPPLLYRIRPRDLLVVAERKSQPGGESSEP